MKSPFLIFQPRSHGIKMKARILSTTIFVGLLSGCAFTTIHDVSVDYSYQPTGEMLSGLEHVKLGQFTDGRNVENPRMIMNKQNLAAVTTSGGWQAEKPLSEIVRDGVGQAISAHRHAERTHFFELTGELVDFRTESKMGMWSELYKGRLTLEFQLRNLDSGEIVWRNSFKGVATVTSFEGAAGLFRETLDELINALVQDEYIIQQLNKH